MNRKTADGLVAHAKQCLQEGWGYVYGALGQTCTKGLLDQCAKAYPANNLAGGAMRRAGEKWLGKKVADCSGMIKAYLMSDYTGGPIQYSAQSDSDVQYSRATVKGPISTMPDIPGILVYMPGHVGVYIGNGQVIESAGTLYGVKKSTVKKSYASGPWTHWYKCPGIEYPKETAQPGVSDKPTVEEKPAASNKPLIDVTYRVRGKKGIWYPAVKNLESYAGVIGEAITDVAVKVSSGKVKYRVHLLGDGWLPYVTGYDIKDAANGYAGRQKPIDAVEIQYEGQGKKIKYRVSTLKESYYGWQYGNEKSQAQDGYAGSFGKQMDRLQIVIE